MRRKLAVLTLVLCLTTWGFAPAVGATAVQQGGSNPALSGQSVQAAQVSTQDTPPTVYTTIANETVSNPPSNFANVSYDISNQTGNDTLYVRFEDSDPSTGFGAQITNLTLTSGATTVVDFDTNTSEELDAAYRGVDEGLTGTNDNNRYVTSDGFFVYQLDISSVSQGDPLTLSTQIKNEYRISVATEAPAPTANTTVGTVNDSVLPDNTTVTRTVTFNATDTSGETGTAANGEDFPDRDAYRTIFPDFLNVTDVSVDVTAPDGSDVPTRANEPVFITNGSSIRYTTNYGGTNPAELQVNLTFTAETNDTGATNTGLIQNRIIDSDNGEGGQSTEVTLQNTTPATPMVNVSNATLDPDSVTEGTTVNHTFTFDVANVSGDGNTDTVNVTLPAVGSITNSDVDVVDSTGSSVSLSSTPNLFDANGGTDNGVTLALSPNQDLDVTVTANVTVAFDDGVAPVSGPVTATVDDSAYGSDSDSDEITVNEAPAAPTPVGLDNVSLDPNTVDENTTVTHTLNFTVQNVSLDGANDTVNATLPSVASFAGLDATNTSFETTGGATVAPVDTNVSDQTVSVTFNETGGGEADVNASVVFDATFDEVGSNTTAAASINVSDSANGMADGTVDVTVVDVTEPTPTPVDGNVTLSNVSLVPDQADEDTTETHTLNFTVQNLSSDGATDTVNATLPSVATITDVGSVTVNGDNVTGAATLTNDARSVVVVSNTTGGGAATANVSATFDATFDNVTGPNGTENVTADATIDVTDSANGSTSGAVPITVVNTLNSSVTFNDQQAENDETVTVAEATLSDGGFVVIHANNSGSPGEVLGVSSYLAPGTATNVSITLDSPLTANQTLFAMAHADDGDQTYEFPDSDLPYPDDGFLDSAEVTVQNETPSTPMVDVSNATLDPDNVTEGTTVNHTFTFDVANVSGDGNTDIVNVTLPAVGSITNSDVDVVDSTGSSVSLSSSPNLFDADGGTNNGVTLALSPDQDRDVTVTANVTVAFDDGVAPISGPVTATVDDSAYGSDSDSDEITVNAAQEPAEASLTVDTSNVSNLTAGSTTSVPLVINTTTDDGLAGYDLNVTVDNAAAVQVTGVDYNTGAFNLTRSANFSVSNGTQTVELRAVDLQNNTVANQSDLVLANLTIEGQAAGTATFDVDVDQVDDDTGGLVQTASVPSSLTVENQTTPFPDGLPGGAPESGVPTDPDGDGLFEDLDGDGDFDFVDVIEFVFALDTLQGTNLTQAQNDALDFEADGQINFVDVIELVFQIET